jgi:4-carboxymuconolactone decarboxylase
MRAILTLLCLMCAVPAHAQTLTVFSSNATRALVQELGPQFEKASGNKVTFTFGNSVELKNRIEKGEAFDVAILTSTLIAELTTSGRLVSPIDVARAGVGMAIHPQASKPDISTPDALKGALLAARSIAYVEQGATASILRGIAAKLGIADVLKTKTVSVDSAAHAVAERKAEIGFTQISEILNVPGATFAAPLPPELQVYTTFQAGINARSASAAAAGRFIAFITSAQAAPVIRAKGLESAGDRLPPIPDAQLTAAQREAIAAFKEARGAAVTGPFHPLLRSPELMTRTRAMGDYLRYKSALPPRLSELVILITAREWTQQYEWNAHYPIALKAGLRREVADAIAEGQRPRAMQDDEAALFDLCRELHTSKTVSDGTYARALALFGEKGVVDAIGISGYYSMLAMVLNTARTPSPDNGSPILKPIPR